MGCPQFCGDPPIDCPQLWGDPVKTRHRFWIGVIVCGLRRAPN